MQELEDDDEGFASCEDDDMNEEDKYMIWHGQKIESDLYFEYQLDQLHDEEEKMYIR